MDRPALKRLLEDVSAGKIDAVVVYKVDRLTRALGDFAKIIERFDAHQVSFVSVTQQFNTTTSMGRLTLNVLLSFAQFEREVTGERIRDKIAASKKKGMWMGGVVPLGYDIVKRRLVVNVGEAQLVRRIFRKYCELGCVSKLKAYLERNGIKSKVRISASGNRTGGSPYSRGALYSILQNRVYLGEVAHREHIYAGDHNPIVTRQIWSAVQKQCEINRNAQRNNSRALVPSLLTGLIYDSRGIRFTPSHTVKAGKRYRYYVSQRSISNPGVRHTGLIRVSANDIEQLTITKLRSFLESERDLISAADMQPRSASVIRNALAVARNCSETLATAGTGEKCALLHKIVDRIVITDVGLDILISKKVLGKILVGSDIHPHIAKSGGKHIIRIKGCFTFHGSGTKLVVPNEISGCRQVPSLIKAICRGYDWYVRIIGGRLAGRKAIATETKLPESYVNRILSFAFLAPDIVEAIRKGQQERTVTIEQFRQQLPLSWRKQRRLFASGGAH